MQVTDKEIILSLEDDCEFCKLIAYVVKIDYGEFKVLVRKKKPSQIIEIYKQILLSKEGISMKRISSDKLLIPQEDAQENS